MRVGRMIKGHCLCGRVEYIYAGEVNEIAQCHCHQCKRAQGTPFATNAPVNAELFSLTKGEHLLKEFFSSANKKRVFCSECGSPIYSARTDLPGVVRLRVGTITEGRLPALSYEIYCESRSNWYCAESSRPCYSQEKD